MRPIDSVVLSRTVLVAWHLPIGLEVLLAIANLAVCRRPVRSASGRPWQGAIDPFPVSSQDWHIRLIILIFLFDPLEPGKSLLLVDSPPYDRCLRPSPPSQVSKHLHTLHNIPNSPSNSHDYALSQAAQQDEPQHNLHIRYIPWPLRLSVVHIHLHLHDALYLLFVRRDEIPVAHDGI